MDLGLKNKVAIVTAASKGLGKASAQALAQEGARIVICSRNKRAIAETASELRKATKAHVISVAADVSKLSDLNMLVATAKRNFGTVHILVNNAGGPPHGDVLSLPDKEWRNGVDLTLMSAIRLTRLVLPMMISQRWGRVITITSITAKQPINELLVSSTLRPGILGLTKVLSNQFAHAEITINAVCPGYILTDRQNTLMAARALKAQTTVKEYFTDMTKDIPAGRLGRPEEVGHVIAFLASAQASYVNGANLLIDGGLAKGIH